MTRSFWTWIVRCGRPISLPRHVVAAPEVAARIPSLIRVLRFIRNWSALLGLVWPFATAAAVVCSLLVVLGSYAPAGSPLLGALVAGAIALFAACSRVLANLAANIAAAARGHRCSLHALLRRGIWSGLPIAGAISLLAVGQLRTVQVSGSYSPGMGPLVGFGVAGLLLPGLALWTTFRFADLIQLIDSGFAERSGQRGRLSAN